MITLTRRLTVAALTAATAAIVLSPVTAQAVAPFGSAHRVLPASCAGSMTVLNSAGDRHGFTACRLASGYDALYAVSTAGSGSWKRVKVVSTMQYLMAVADDGHTSYALYNGLTGIELATRTRSGTTHVKKLAAADRYGLGAGALVARGGKWLAAWSAGTATTGGTGCFSLFQARTLGGTQAAHNTGLCASDPSLALQGTSPVLTYRTSIDDAGGAVEVSSWHSGTWSKPHQLTGANQAGKLPTVSVTGSTVRVTWLQLVQSANHYVAHLATKAGHGAWHATTFPTPAAFDTVVTSHPQSAQSKGKLFVAWTVVGAGNKETIEVEEHAGGKWTKRQVGDGTGGDAVLTQLAATKGRAYLVLEHSDRTVYDLAARQ